LGKEVRRVWLSNEVFLEEEGNKYILTSLRDFVELDLEPKELMVLVSYLSKKNPLKGKK